MINTKGRVLQTIRWSTTEYLIVPTTARVELQVKRVVGFTSNDTKQQNLISGIKTCTTICPCATCVLEKKHFRTTLLAYFEAIIDEHPDIKEYVSSNEFVYKDCSLREGNFASELLHEMWRETTVDGNLSFDRDQQLSVASVQHPVLLPVHPMKDVQAPMHSGQSPFTRIGEAAREVLPSIEFFDEGNNSAWRETVECITADVEAVIANSKSEMYQQQHEVAAGLISIVESYKEQLDEESKSDSLDEAKLEEYQSKLTAAKKTLKEHVDSGYGQNLKLQNAAARFAKQIDYYKKSRKPKGPAEYVFVRAIEIYGGVRYRPEHSGFELSNDDGISVLENWDKVCDAVNRVYERNTSMGNKVGSFIDKTRKIATPLLTISKLLKSQKKFTPERIRQLKEALVLHSMAWRIGFPHKNIWLKLHRLETHIVQFIERWGFVGRRSEEGFEAVHPILNGLFKMSSHIVNTETRATSMSRQIAVDMASDVIQVVDKVKSKFTKRKYGPNRKRSASRQGASGRTILSEELTDEIEGDYIDVSNDEVIKKSWVPLYMLIEAGKVPEHWSKAFYDNPTLGEEIKVKSEYSSH